MNYHSGNPIQDAQAYFCDQDKASGYSYHCLECGVGFESGCGKSYDQEHFCDYCINEGLHIRNWQAAGLTKREINSTLLLVKPL